jgi:ABC-type sugar transport system, periplasmic component
MQMIKRMLSLAALCLLLAGCNRNETKIAFFVYDGSDTFISEMMAHMASEIAPEISAVFRDAGNSQAVQNQQLGELIEEGGYRLFVINAVDRLACSAIVEKCAKEGIAVVFFNREPLADALTNDNVFYVGADADKLGEKQADMVAELFSGGSGFLYDKNGDGVIQLIILKGEQGHQDAEKRTENCVGQLKELGFEVEILATEIANWTRHEGFQAMQTICADYADEIELVFSNNDDMALGAIDYLIDAKVVPKAPHISRMPFPIVAVDGTTVGLEAIAQGYLYGTVNNDSIRQSDAILKLISCILSDGGLENFEYPVTNGHYIYIDGEVITRRNLEDYTNER